MPLWRKQQRKRFLSRYASAHRVARHDRAWRDATTLVEWEHIPIFSTRWDLGCLHEYREERILGLLIGFVVCKVNVDGCHKNKAATKYIRNRQYTEG